MRQSIRLDPQPDLPHTTEEISRAVRRVAAHDGLIIALLNERSGEWRTEHSDGVAGDSQAPERLQEHWQNALHGRQSVTHSIGGTAALTLPLVAGDEAVGAMTVLLSADAGTSPAELERTLGELPSVAASALQRTRRTEAMQATQRLEAIGDVAAGIAHELRNPILGIASAVQLLRFRSRDDPVVERNVGRILREVERLNGMLNDLVEFGRPRPLSLAPGDPDAVWEYVIEGNRGLLESGSLQLQRTRSGHAKLPIDAERLGQALLSVLVFATESAPIGSTLTVDSRVLPNGGWRSTLHAEGEGITDEELPRIFEIFHSSRRSGRGIGLALCRRILGQHGGDIEAHGEQGRGTTLTITLPPAR